MAKIKATLFIEKEQQEKLKKLSEATRVPMGVYVREALDDLFKKYTKVLKKGG